MYEKFFQLRERPFALSPDPEYLYPSRVHREALSHLRYGIEGHAGFVVITGEIGSGKTTLLQTVLGHLDSSTVVSRIVNTMLDPRELLDAIMLDFGLDPTGKSKPVVVRAIADYLVAQRNAGRLVLLVIDEAQNLSLPALEEVRMLSNLETEKSKLLQIVLVGQPDLRDKMNSVQLEQLRQRVTVSYHLNPLGEDDTHAYVNYRLSRAAIGPPLEFPRRGTDLIHARSRGLPRTINVIADATLLTAYGLDQRAITEETVAETIAELDATGVLPPAGEPAVTRAVVQAPAPGLAEPGETAAREAALAARERELRAREEAVTARQRVLEEEARLLREAQRAARAADTPRHTPGDGLDSGTARPAAATAPAPSPAQTAAVPAAPRRAVIQRPGTSTAPAGARAGGTGGAATAPWPTASRPAAPPVRSRPDATLFSEWDRPRGSWWSRMRRALFGAPAPEGY